MVNRPQFSLATYRQLLQSALGAGYEFMPFKSDSLGGQGQCLLRHDVDADLSAALVMAHEENAMGVSATYFLMLRSPLYNIFARRNHETVQKILALGHDIALHYDQGFSPAPAIPDRVLIERETAVLETMFGRKIEAVSFHQPDPAVLQGDVDTGGRINTYNRAHLPGYAYFSDSNRIFKLAPDYVESFNALAGQSIQLLIHPMWWVYEEESTQDVWDRVIIANINLTQQQLLETERAFGGHREFLIK